MSWRDEKKIEIRDRLYAIALDLFREQGYSQTSVRQITERAQVGKGTFFNYFSSKEHVLTEWYRNLSQEIFDSCRDKMFGSAREAIYSLLLSEADKALKDRELISAKHQIALSPCPIAGIEQDQDKQALDYCIHHLRLDINRGRIDSSLDESHFARLIITLMTGNARRWVYHNNDFDLVACIRKDLDFIFDLVEIEQ